MADYTPVTTGGNKPFTSTASAAITGGQLVAVSGTGTVAPAGADSGIVVGVAAHDAANGAKVAVWPLVGPIHETTTSAGVTAGNSLASEAAGGIKSGTLATLAAAGTLLGTALTTASAGNKARWTAR